MAYQATKHITIKTKLIRHQHNTTTQSIFLKKNYSQNIKRKRMITLHKQIQEKTNYNKEQFNTELEIKKHSINYNY